MKRYDCKHSTILCLALRARHFFLVYTEENSNNKIQVWCDAVIRFVWFRTCTTVSKCTKKYHTHCILFYKLSVWTKPYHSYGGTCGTNRTLHKVHPKVRCTLCLFDERIANSCVILGSAKPPGHNTLRTCRYHIATNTHCVAQSFEVSSMLAICTTTITFKSQH